jgi:sugar phosphate isomerase/epimerase
MKFYHKKYNTISMTVNRRNFLQQTALAGTSFFLPSIKEYGQPLKSDTHAGYELLIMGTNWGYGGDEMTFCTQAKKEGYNGIEVWLPGDEKSRNEIAEAAMKNGLALGFVFGGSDKDPVKHLQQFTEGIQNAIKYKPIYINCHSGKDYFTAEQNTKFIDYTAPLSASTGIPIYHETHRGRTLFAAHVAGEFIKKIPGLRLTFDVSHWCNVHESLLGDQEETLSSALDRVDHIHARVGHPEGPQVNDPRAPEWDAAVKAHMGWWDKVAERKKKEGKRLTILTEFGPPDYMPTLPYTRQPLGSQWDINVYMMNLLRKRYA